jgi:hypothetical protein
MFHEIYTSGKNIIGQQDGQLKTLEDDYIINI